MATKIPTFVTESKVLTGSAARQAFNAQACRCNCGCGAGDGTVSGVAGCSPAVWHECSNCNGSAIGRPLLYCTRGQIQSYRATRK